MVRGLTTETAENTEAGGVSVSSIGSLEVGERVPDQPRRRRGRVSRAFRRRRARGRRRGRRGGRCPAAHADAGSLRPTRSRRIELAALLTSSSPRRSFARSSRSGTGTPHVSRARRSPRARPARRPGRFLSRIFPRAAGGSLIRLCLVRRRCDGACRHDTAARPTLGMPDGQRWPHQRRIRTHRRTSLPLAGPPVHGLGTESPLCPARTAR